MLELSGVVLGKQAQQSSQDFLSQTLQIMTQNFDVDRTAQEIIDLLDRTTNLNCCLFIANSFDKEIKIISSNSAEDRYSEIFNSCLKITNYYHNCILDTESEFWCEVGAIRPIISKVIADFPLSHLLLVPVVISDKYYGIFSLQHRDPDYVWQETAVDEIVWVALQYGIACDRQRLIADNQRQQIRIQELEELQRQEEIATGKRKLFIDNLTHELRTPLTSVIGFSHYLIEELFGELNPKQKQYVSAINDSGKHLLEIVNDYLDISKIDADRESLFVERIVVEDICRASLSIVEALATQANIQLIIEIDPRTDFCFADSTRLKQILVNLLSNAIKFTEKGSVTLKVELKDDRIEFSVIDTGIGISEQDINKLFEPFQQLNNQINRRKKGSGLGLVLSQKLARLHGGDLIVTSELAKGSCFTVYLPSQNVSD
jgi:signal transduction histidine kinase